MSNISLKNPSFEDTPRRGGVTNAGSIVGKDKIKGWFDCGAIHSPRESAPDIHPGDSWGVGKEPYEGETYLGLVVRDNDTWESVSQKLASKDGTMTPMVSGNCYRLSMAVARAESYVSGSRLRMMQKGDIAQIYNYTTPTVIRVWGGDSHCNIKELLATSNPVINSEWETIELDFTPKEDFDFITIQAYYKVPVLFPYNGHVLVDNLSDIVQVTCKE